MLSIQERLYPALRCFGCGPSNARGLQLRSYPSGDGSVEARFMPWPEHDNGLGSLNGGIIATLLDCHSAAAVFAEADHRGWCGLGGAALPYVTAGLQVRYLRPTPLREVVDLHARIIETREHEIVADVHLLFDGKIRASAAAQWRRWRPRHGRGSHG